jgi:glycosyltransferase involved in cell wall biosynthesis
MIPKYSVIIPVYNRPKEVEELLESLTHQTNKDFDVILVEDGSTVTSEGVYEKYSNVLPISYFFKPNSGPGPSRNFGFERATGDYFVVFDSDCILPSSYFESVGKALLQTPLDAWGGPDRGSEHFTAAQRAMAYTMSSALTTGGIRGASAKGFQPRSFNMGVRKEVFQKTGGFRFDRFAEDIEWSIRIKKAGFRVGLIPEAYVYHKRRTDFNLFFKQVSNFGKGRVRVGRVHREAIRITHWFPSFFLLGLLVLPFIVLLSPPLGLTILLSYGLYLVAIAVDAGIKTNSLAVACLSVPSALIQLTGYGSGFLKEKLTSRG